MGETPALRRFGRLARVASGWPAPVRDLGAAGLAVFAICLGELLAMALPVPAEALLALPGVLLAWLVLGGTSAVFSLLVALAVVALLGQDRVPGLVGVGVHEPLELALMAAACIAICAGARLWARRREARAELLMDACAAEALRRIAAAEAETAAARHAVAQAAAEVAEARRALARRDAGIEEAMRREGGV